jgi:uncharacterized protein YbjT (DUF2867 family)
MSPDPRHVVFGTEATGLATMDALLRRGETVRMVNRSGSARVPDGVEVAGGNAADPAFTTAVSRGARVVYQTLNHLVVDSSRIAAELGVRATPAEQAIAATLAWYRESRTGGTATSAARDTGPPKV